MIRAAVIGATGSVGAAVLDVIAAFPGKIRVTALASRSNSRGLLELVRRFKPHYACLANPGAEDARMFRAAGATLLSGNDGLSAIARMPETDNVVFASSGTDAIVALQHALSAGKDISLANKESIVAAGPWVMPLVSRPDQLRPVDSEHSAIWQCLRDEPQNTVERVYLTASGGPFRDTPREEMERVTPEAALKHPTWKMGPKITIDSATLMNKGIECIEAMQLFDLPSSRVGALIHPKSLVHGLVRFNDSTVKLLFSAADMRIPAACALAWPDRLPLADRVGTPAITGEALEFFEPDAEKFPCLPLALEAGRRGGAYPPLLIGADEYAVNAFLEKRISFAAIPTIIEQTLEQYSGAAPRTLGDAIDLIAVGRRMAGEYCRMMEG